MFLSIGIVICNSCSVPEVFIIFSALMINNDAHHIIWELDEYILHETQMLLKFICLFESFNVKFIVCLLALYGFIFYLTVLLVVLRLFSPTRLNDILNDALILISWVICWFQSYVLCKLSIKLIKFVLRLVLLSHLLAFSLVLLATLLLARNLLLLSNLFLHLYELIDLLFNYLLSLSLFYIHTCSLTFSI